MIKSNPVIVYEEIVAKTEKSRSTVARSVKKLSDAGRIKRSDAEKNGMWEIL